MLTYLLIQWRHIVTMSHNTFHSSSIDKRQRRRLANVDIQLRHLVTIRSPNSFHSGHLAITVTLRGPDGDRYGQVLLYLYLLDIFHGHARLGLAGIFASTGINDFTHFHPFCFVVSICARLKHQST